jgi:hypothetical protein
MSTRSPVNIGRGSRMRLPQSVFLDFNIARTAPSRCRRLRLSNAAKGTKKSLSVACCKSGLRLPLTSSMLQAPDDHGADLIQLAAGRYPNGSAIPFSMRIADLRHARSRAVRAANPSMCFSNMNIAHCNTTRRAQHALSDFCRYCIQDDGLVRRKLESARSGKCARGGRESCAAP